MLGKVIYVWKWNVKAARTSPTLWDPVVYKSPWNSPGHNTGVGSLSLLQEIFPTQGSNPGLPHCKQILYQLSHKGSPRILEWVANPFSRGSSQPRNQTRISCIAGRFLPTELSGKPKIYVYISLNLVQSYEARTLLPHFYRWDKWGTERLKNLFNMIFKGPGSSKMLWFLNRHSLKRSTKWGRIIWKHILLLNLRSFFFERERYSLNKNGEIHLNDQMS